ncbi:hypothetical protein BGP_4089 [Beggiatoa sp. PS]|nr:hypothetical protein BGP_4089 [Beggiatoa sp. PS]
MSVLTASGFERGSSYSNSLEQLLNHAMTGQRGSVTRAGRTGRWATKEISFQVK